MLRPAQGLILLVALGESVASEEPFSTFSPNCTLPPPGTRYVGRPNTRSTSGILWSCVSILVLCTWNIQHLNVPAVRATPRNVFQQLWWSLLDSQAKIRWMITTVLSPEVLVAKALGQWLSARDSVLWMASELPRSGVEWTMTHAYMANMGYFVLDRGEDVVDDTLKETASAGYSTHFQINMRRLQHRYWAPDANQWKYIFMRGIADCPSIPAGHLARLDRGGGALLKAIAVAQTVHLMAQLLARTTAALPSAQLEIAAFAFSVLSAITYLLYWECPQGIETVHVVRARRPPTADEVISVGIAGPMYLWPALRFPPAFDPQLGPAPIPNDAWHNAGHGTFRGDFDGAVLGGVVFGLLHCLAWNYQFPTPGEAVAWRICTLLTVCVPPVAVIPAYLWMRLNPANPTDHSHAVSRLRTLSAVALFGVFFTPYFIARAFLMIEVFRGLSYLPPEAFVDTWSAYFPAWG